MAIIWNAVQILRLGRRNLPPDVASLLRGRIYNRVKRTMSEAGAMKGSLDQSDLSSNTADTLATQYGVGSATIERDGQFARAVDVTLTSLADAICRLMW